MSAEVETEIRRIFTASTVPAEGVEAAAVIHAGLRVRARRRRMWAGSSLAALLVGIGAAQLVVPATGTPVSPLIWAAGEEAPGSESGAWVVANNRRYVLSIRDVYVRRSPEFVVSVMRPDGSLDDIMSMGPILSAELPAGGLSSSAHPGVTFALFPDGATGIVARQADGTPLTVSTMRITGPHGGPTFVAAAFGSSSPDGSAISVTWRDATGSVKSWTA